MIRKIADTWKLALVWAMSLAAVAIAASALTFAQPRLESAPILSGSDIGFRVEGQKRGAPVGTLMVRIDGQWVEAGWATKAMPAK